MSKDIVLRKDSQGASSSIPPDDESGEVAKTKKCQHQEIKYLVIFEKIKNSKKYCLFMRSLEPERPIYAIRFKIRSKFHFNHFVNY